MSEPSMFAEQIKAIHEAMIAVENSQWDPEEGDPRNLDPDDEPLASMMWAANDLKEAVEALEVAIGKEMQERNAKLDEMSEAEYEAWEARVA